MAYTAIDIGTGVAPNEYDAGAGSQMDKNNSANAAGVLTSFSIRVGSAGAGGVKMGTFYGSGTSFTLRDVESLGSVSAGVQTYTGRNCDVAVSDVIAGSHSSGGMRFSGGGGTAGANYSNSDLLVAGTNTWGANPSSYTVALYATGITVPDAPTSVSATDNLSDKVTITWTAGTGETDGHRVYRDGSDISGVVAHDTATYDDTTGTAGVTYSYIVYAINPAGLSAASTADNGLKTGVPVLTTSPISSLVVSGFTANGEITNTGGVNATIRGFCYMIGSSGDPDIISNFEVHDDGDYGVISYSKAITGLDLATNNYRVRAYAVNTVGTGYGQTITVSKTIKTRFNYGVDVGTGKLSSCDDSKIGSNTWREMQVMLNKSVQGGSLSSNGIVSTYGLVITTDSSYTGAILAQNGDIHFVPYGASVGQKISAAGVVSTYSLVYTVANAYSGGVLAPNGDIHFVPYYNANRGQKISSAGVVSTYSLVYTALTAYWGGVLAPNGDIHFIPRTAIIGQKISAAGVVSTYSLVHTSSSGAYLSGVLAPNGDIHFIPSGANRGQKISAAGVVSTYSLVYTAGPYNGGVLAPNGDIHFIPNGADRGQKIDINGVVSTYSLVYSAGVYSGGVLAPNGDIHFISSAANVGQKISAVGVVSTYSLVYTTSNAYYSGVLAPNGDIHFIPRSADRGQKISTNPAIPFSQAVCLSPFFNKF